MKRSLTIGVDIDEVCADLLTACCNFYNLWHRPVEKLPLLPEDLKGWDLNPVFGPGWQQWLTEPTFYSHCVLPVQGARRGIYELLAAGHRVVYVTSCVPGTADAKQRWLKKWGFLTDANYCRDYIAAADKSLIGVDVLFDDGVHNVDAFPGRAFLVNHWHNAETPCTRPRIRGMYESLPALRAAGLSF